MGNDNRPVIIVIAGPNGSGKTSLTGQLLKHEWVEGCTYINPDFIAKDRFGDWNSPETVLKAAKYATALREQCLNNLESCIFETVFSSEEKVTYLKRAEDLGYFVRLFFVSTDHPTINASRVAQRVMEGGHDVPIPKIVSRYYKAITNCCIASTFVDRLYVYDNSIDFAPAKLLFRATKGNIEKTYGEINNWAKPILETLSE